MSSYHLQMSSQVISKLWSKNIVQHSINYSASRKGAVDSNWVKMLENLF